MMGYDAQVDWNLRITTSLRELVADVRAALEGKTYMPLRDGEVDVLHDLMMEMHEEADLTVHVDGTGVGAWTGWGGGKCLSLASEDSIWSVLARHCVGTVDWWGEDGALWRLRMYGNGEFREFRGEVVYPLDNAALVGA